LDSRKGIIYPRVCNPRTATYTYGDVVKATTEPAVTTPPAERQEQWNITPAKGGKSKSYAAATKTKPQPQTQTAQSKSDGPQRKYGDVPTHRFMQAPPKPPPRRSGGTFGKKWMIRFHKDEKPTTGTRMPTQAVISVVNAAISQFNIKVNVAEWSPVQNLLLYFTGDSTNGQITKARATIMGVLARGCLRSTFLECVKWSRIVVHDVPTQDWNTSNSEFVDVDAKSMEAALRESHPILTDATFMEGPDWTARDGPKVGSTNANISFAIPDHDESHLKAITKSPLVVRADLGGHLKYSRRWSGVRAGVLLGAQGAVRRGESRGGL